MRRARLLTVAILSAALVGGCTTASAGWTYAPAPTKSAAPSSEASAGASGEPGGSGNPNLVVISALNVKYEQATVTAPANTPFQIQFDNKDAGVPHNVTIHLGGSTGAELFKGTVFNGVETRTYDVPALDAGQYAFVCTVHPTMIGTLNAQ
jgi:plastocyanin